MFKLHKDRIQYQKPFSQGSKGTLFPYQKNPEDHKWLIKLITTEDVDTIFKLLPGITLGFSCDHPSILSNKGYCIEKAAEKNGYELYVKLPRAKESLEESLKKRRESKTPFTEKEILKHFYSLVSGLEYLHKKKISHNNMKTSNIMINDKGDIKIADVGIKSGDYLQGKMTAPELFGKKDSDCQDQDLYKADMWGLGLIMIEMALLESNLIDPSLPREDLESKILESLKNIEENSKGGDCLVQLISPLVHYESNKRPNAGEMKVAVEKALKETQDLSSGIKIQQGFEVIEDHEYENKRLNEYIERELRQQKEQYEEKILQLLKEQERVQEEKKRLENADFQLKEQIRIREETEKQKCLKKFEEDLQKISKPIFDVKMIDQDTLSIFIQGLPFRDYEQALAGVSTYSRTILEIWTQSGMKGPLPSLEIDASNCSLTFTDLIMAGVVEGFAKSLTGLSFLKLDFNFCVNLREKSLSYLAVIVANYLKNLRGFRLSISECDNVADQGIIELANALRDSMQELHYLEFDFGGRFINQNVIKSLASVVERHANSLQGIDFQFYRCEGIDNTSFESLVEVLKGGCSKLRSLQLNLDTSKIDSKFLTELAFIFASHYENLEKLCLDFGSCQNLTDEGMDEFGMAIGRYLTKLTELTLHFDYCPGISQKGLDELCLSIGNNLQMLKKVSLNFGSCPEMKDQGLKYLEGFIGRKIEALEELELNFGRCLGITDEEVICLAKSLETNLPNLQALKISLDQCELITDQGVEVLGKTLGTYGKNLEDLFLDVGACNNLGNKGVVMLSVPIAKNLKNLKKLNLNVRTDKVTQAQILALKDALSFIPSLEMSSVQKR